MRIAIVQSRAYQTFAGGDGAYVEAVVRHLEDHGHSLYGLTSGSTKGRPRLLLKLVYAGTRRMPWRFRSAFRIGRRYVALGPQLFRDAADFVWKWRRGGDRGGLSPFAVAPGAVERRWICRQLSRLQPDLAILCFEAAAVAADVDRLGIRTLALIGFLPSRGYAIGDGAAGGSGSADASGHFLDAVRAADFISFNSIDDCNFARERLGIARPTFIGMGFARKARRTAGVEPVLLFVGNKTAPNRGAISWFLEHVWPRVRQAAPQARFRIVGRSAHYFAGRPMVGVECVGEVKTLDDEYCGARIVVAPLRTGSAGVKTKVAEAISFGCPIVSTSLGVDAADIGQIDRAGYVEDNAGAFAARIVDLLRNDGLWREKQAGTDQVFEDLFSRDSAYREFDRLLELISRGCQPRSAGETGDIVGQRRQTNQGKSREGPGLPV